MSIFAIDWQASQADKKWRNDILLLDHKLPELPQLALASLAKLIEILPRENNMLMHTGRL
jgi:hypothetical protein